MSTGSCGAQLAAAANCAVMVSYTPSTASAPATQNAVLNLGFGDVPAGTAQTRRSLRNLGRLAGRQVTATNNPQVALYTMTLPFPGSMTVSFGKDTTYGTEDMGAVDDGQRRPSKHFCRRHEGEHHLPYAGRGAVHQRHQCSPTSTIRLLRRRCRPTCSPS